MYKRILLTLIILSLAAGTAFSGCPMCGMDRGKVGQAENKAGKLSKKVKKAVKDLDLSEEQAKQMDDLLNEKKTKKKAVQAESERKMEAIRNEYRTKLAAILTPEQLEKYNARKDKRVKKDRKHKKHKHD